MDEWKLGYLAGMIDGEGCISISKNRKGRRGEGYICYVKITNTHLPTLEFLQKEFGGAIYNFKNLIYYKQSHELYWSGWKGKNILRLISGKLSIKKEIAELYLLFPLGTDGNRLTYSEIDHQLRESIYLKMKELNRRSAISFEVSEPHDVNESEGKGEQE